MSDRPKILQILYSGLGGHYAVATTLVHSAGKDDPWDHHLLFFGIEPVAPGYASDCKQAGIAYSYVQSKAGRPFMAWPALMREVRRIAPDVIVLHSIKAIFAMRRVVGRTPLIAVEHQPNVLKSKAEWIASAASQFLADRVILLSRDYYTTMRAKLGSLLREERTVIVPTGIDLSLYTQGKPAFEAGQKLRLGMAARFTEKKAQEVLVEAAHLLRTQHPELDIAFTLAGDGPCMPQVRAAVEHFGVGDMVELPGHIAAEKLPDWFATLDLYAHATDGETLSTSLLQAMAVGLPITASAVPGVTDLLGPPEEGQEPLGTLVKARDAQAFADAIARYARDPEFAGKQGERSKQHVHTKHSPQAMRSGYTKVIEAICREKSST